MGFSLGEWANLYLDYCRQRLSESRYKAKCLAYRHLFQSVPPVAPVDALQKPQVLQHFTRLIEAGRTPNAVNEDLKNLRAGWNWAREMMTGFPQRGNPFSIPMFPGEQQPRYVPPLDDFWAVYARAETEQDEVMLLSFLCLAARRNELFRLRVTDVDMGRRQVALGTRKRQGGGLQYDWVPMADQLLPRMEEQIGRVPGPWVFPNPATGEPYLVRTTWMRRLCDRARVRRFGLHAIRHLTASLLAASGVPTVQIQRVLRHQRISTTDTYIRSLGGGAEAVSAAIPLPPKRDKAARPAESPGEK